MRHALTLAPLQLAQALVGFCAIALFTRLMNAEDYGRYALALSLSMLAHTLAFTGAEAAAFRFLAKARTDARIADHFATLLALAAVLGLATFTAAASLLWLCDFDHDVAALAAFAAGAAFFRFLIRLARESERAALDLRRYAIAETAYLVIGFAAGVAALLSFDLGPAAPFAGLLAAGVLVSLWDGPRLFAAGKGGRVERARALAYVGYGTPLALALCIDLGVQACARLILADASGADGVGAYAAAFGLVRPLDVVFMSAGAMFAPLLFNAFEDSPQAARKAAANGFVLLAALAIPAAVGLALIAAPLADVMVGEALRAETAQTLPWLAIAGLMSGFNLYYWSEAFQLTRRTGLRAALMAAPGVAQLLMTAWLAPILGAPGAAIATALSAAFGALLLIAVGARLFALPAPAAELARIAAAAGLMAGAVLASAPFGLLAALAAGLASYALAVLAFDACGARAQLAKLLATASWRRRAHAH